LTMYRAIGIKNHSIQTNPIPSFITAAVFICSITPLNSGLFAIPMTTPPHFLRFLVQLSYTKYTTFSSFCQVSSQREAYPPNAGSSLPDIHNYSMGLCSRARSDRNPTPTSAPASTVLPRLPFP